MQFKGEELLGQEVKSQANSMNLLAASAGRTPRAEAMQTRGIAITFIMISITITVTRVKYVQSRGMEKTYGSGTVSVQRGAMHAFIFEYTHLEGQDAHAKIPEAVQQDPRPRPLRRRVWGVVIKHDHLLVMKWF